MHNQNIHTKTAFREDLKYAREMIRRIEVALRGNDWEAVADECNEVEQLFSSMRCRATDNLEDAQSKKQWEEIQQAERARWQKIADKVCGDFTTAYGITFTGTVA